MLLNAICLTLLGLCLGSFVNALVWRVHEGRDFVKERSVCPKCGHTLAARDLIPVLSYVLLGRKCRYCGQSISRQYPATELIGAGGFLLSYWFWPVNLTHTGNLILFITWLISFVGLLALTLYDLRWMLLPNKILYPTFLITALGYLIYWLGFAGDKTFFLINWFLSIAVAGGIFLVIYVISSGQWIGFGDVRLGLITGTLLHKPTIAFLMVFLSSVLGSLAALPSLLTGKRGINSKLPYGPFLILATFICLLFGQTVLDWYQKTFLP
jgi:leader peptidase (prepilin peptidase)/N-methyltransferase